MPCAVGARWLPQCSAVAKRAIQALVFTSLELQKESQRAVTRLYASERCMWVVRIGCIWSDAVSSAPLVLAPGYTCMPLASQQPLAASLHSCNVLPSSLLTSSHTMLQVAITHS